MFTAIGGQNGAKLKPLVKVGVMGCPPARKHKKAKRDGKRRHLQKRHTERKRHPTRR